MSLLRPFIALTKHLLFALIAFCRKELTGYKVPKHVYFRAELPKTNVGKILRRALRDELRTHPPGTAVK